MTTISSTAPIYPINADTTAGGGSAASKTDASSDVANRFLTLLVTQLQNQDPLNPLDNAQVTSQLAQLSTVNGINKLNDTLSGLAKESRRSFWYWSRVSEPRMPNTATTPSNNRTASVPPP